MRQLNIFHPKRKNAATLVNDVEPRSTKPLSKVVSGTVRTAKRKTYTYSNQGETEKGPEKTKNTPQNETTPPTRSQELRHIQQMYHF